MPTEMLTKPAASPEDQQLLQTVEMFEVITQSQPLDYQSLEILKEAYNKLGRETDAVNTSKRIASAYVQMGQLSSAILEYETILQRFPEDAEAKSALAQIETTASSFPIEAAAPVAEAVGAPTGRAGAASPQKSNPVAPSYAPGEVNDGRQAMLKIFVDGKHITADDFDKCWVTPASMVMPPDVVDPFIQLLSDKAILPVEKSLRLLVDKGRVGYLPLERYDLDMDLGRSFPAAVCRRWCVLPFDRMSKSVFVATANPFNQQAAKELAAATHQRVVWYVASPVEIVKNLRKVFR
jgi:tetratricopeptide (TPR) repeat protein